MTEKKYSDDLTDEILGHQGDYDSSSTTADEDGSVLERLEDLNVKVSPGGRLIKSKDYPESVQVDDEGYFVLSLFDRDTGAVASADITAGTYDVDRIRAGATTNIVSGAALSKADGKVYVEYTFASANWDEGDLFKVVFSGVQVDIGGETYYVEDTYYVGRVSQEVDIETKIDAIQTDLGDPSVRTYNDTIEDMLGIPDLADATVYAGLAKDAIYYDGNSGITGTDYPNGTPEYPVSDEQDAIDIADNRNINTIKLIGGSFTVPSAISNMEFEGLGDLNTISVDFNDKEIDNCVFRRVRVTGDLDSSVIVELDRCLIGNVGNFGGTSFLKGRDCYLREDTVLGGDDLRLNLYRVYPENEDAQIIDTGSKNFILIDTEGDFEIRGQDAGTPTSRIFMKSGKIEIGASCTAGTFDVFGEGEVTDNSGGGCTVNDYTLQGRDKGLDRISDAVSKGTGTEIAADKAVADALGHDGTTDLDTGLMAQLQDYINDDPDSVYNRLGDPTARTNAQTILALLNLPDAAASTLYDFLVEGGDTSGQSANVDGGIIEILKYIAEDTLNGDRGTLTADGTEQTVFEKTDTTPFVFGGYTIDLENMAAGDTTIIRVKKKIKSGGRWIQLEPDAVRTYTDAQDTGEDYDSEGKIISTYGVQILLEQTGGTNRDYDWEIHKVDS